MAKLMKHNNPTECTNQLSAVQDALYVLNGKWKLPIIIALIDGNKRFGDLQRAITGIHAKVLSNELKNLELNGFVKRHVYDTTPVSVEYEITEYSGTLEGVLKALAEWGSMHKRKIRAQLRDSKLRE
jgi:DNA-binding HxlR family transcriptional regulator